MSDATDRLAVVHRIVVVMTRWRPVIRPVVHRVVTVVVMYRTVVHGMVHDDHTTRLRHRHYRCRESRNGQRDGNHKLLHVTPLACGNPASMEEGC
jgi:hypothetical protein